MIATLFLLVAADPGGFIAAIQSADNAKVHSLRSQSTISISAIQLKRLGKVAQFEGEVRPLHRGEGVPSTNSLYTIDLIQRDGKSKRFRLVGGVLLEFDTGSIQLANLDLFEGLQELFGERAPKRPFEPELRQAASDGIGEISALALNAPGTLVLAADKSRHSLMVFVPSGIREELRLIAEHKHERLRSPKALVIRGRFAYMGGDVSVVVFRCAALTGTGTAWEFVEARDRGATALGVSEDGRFLYAAGGNMVVVYETSKDGPLRFVQRLTVPGMLFPNGMAAIGDRLFITDFGNSLITFACGETGEIELAGMETDRNEGGFIKPEDRALMMPSGVVADGQRLFVHSLHHGVSIWELKDKRATFTTLLQKAGNPPSERIKKLHDIVLTKDRLWLATASEKSLLWFDWDEEEGDEKKWIYKGSKDFGHINTIVLSGSGKTLYAGGEGFLKAIRVVPEPPTPPGR